MTTEPMSEPTLYQDAEPWTDGAIATWVVPVEPDLASRIMDRIIAVTRDAQRTTHAANPEMARTEHITEHLLTGIHADLFGVLLDALGIGDNDA